MNEKLAQAAIERQRHTLPIEVCALRSFSLTKITGADIRIKVTDIGANPIDGVPPYKPLLDVGIAEIVGFEPAPEALANLNRRKGPHEIYLPHAVGDGKRHTLNFCYAPGMTSLLEPNKAILELFHGFPGWGRVLSQEDLQTVCLDDVVETMGTDLIKIDIQGAELMALSLGCPKTASTVQIYCPGSGPRQQTPHCPPIQYFGTLTGFSA
ncbi:MAG: FkbM family methyltransferase [Magnetococcales bacterium]|nr:FkbM family methyltransferase [Magnetococcales bacterium]